MQRNGQYRVLAVLRPRTGSQLDGGSSTVDRRLVKVMSSANSARDGKKRRGGAK